MPKSVSARLFVALIVLSGLLVLGDAAFNARSMPTARFAGFLLVACAAARLKIKLPGLTGTMSVNLPFILMAAAEMNAPEALAVALVSTLVQCLPGSGQKFSLVQAAFNCSAITLAAAAARWIYASPGVTAMVPSPALRLAIAGGGYFLANSAPVAIVIWLTEHVSILRTWLEMFQLSFPYMVASAGVAGISLTVTQEIGWQVPLVVLAIMAGIFFSYRRYFAETAIRSTVASLQLPAGDRVRAEARV
jgi:hypothetical protein